MGEELETRDWIVKGHVGSGYDLDFILNKVESHWL